MASAVARHAPGHALFLMAALMLSAAMIPVYATGRQLLLVPDSPPSGPGGPCRYGHAPINCQEGLFCTILASGDQGGSGICENQGVCGTGDAELFPSRCWFNSDPEGRYVCCDRQGCDGFNAPDYKIPHCKNNGYVPPGYGIQGGTSGGGTSNPPPNPPPIPTADFGMSVCGMGAAYDFPIRCWYNNDPQHRYVCCDKQGCDGFNSDNLSPHCANYGYVPPNYGG